MKRTIQILRSKRVLFVALAVFLAMLITAPSPVRAQQAPTPPEPLVAIHVSELTQALETMPATPPTPTGQYYTGYEWWYLSWHYFVPYESLKEALRSDGTPYVEVSDADIAAGNLLHPDGTPRYPILISLASEAVADGEVAPLRDYVAAGGFLFIGSSAFTRNPNGTTREDFALADELGLHMVNPSLTPQNWYSNTTFSKVVDHRLAAGIPEGTLTWRMPLTSEEIPLGVSPNHGPQGAHYVFRVSADSNAVVIANGDSGPLLATTPYGMGNFIYHGAIQPLIAHGGYDSGLYAYLIYRNAIEWAFEAANVPIIKLSPWRYGYDAAFVVRHDFENDPAKVQSIENSASFEHSLGVKGDYYFCTGTLRDEMPEPAKSTAIAGLQSAVSIYGATIGPHNGGLRNPRNPALVIGNFDYWHWGPDEALDVTPAGYASGKAYAQESISLSFQDIEGWLSGVDNGRPGCGTTGNCPRIWASPYFNSTREDSYGIVENVGAVVSMGEQKIGPFPHWTLSTQTAGKRFSHITLPVDDWFVGGAVAQAMENHTSETMRAAVDFYYNLGALVSIYGHMPSANNTMQGEYVTYSVAKPRMWSTNVVEIFDWWQMRSDTTVTTTYAVAGNTATALALITGAADPDTAIEVAVSNVTNPDVSDFDVYLNGSPADPSDYRVLRNAVKIRVGVSPATAEVRYTVPNPIPSTTNLSPTMVAAGGPAFDLTVNGRGFVDGSVVRWNGANRTTTFVSPTQLTASVQAADIAAAGTAQVTVFTPAPGGGVSNAQTFTINNPAPATTSLSPAVVIAGGASFTLTVNGSDFVPSSAVRWNGADRTTTFVSPTQLTASVQAADIAAAGTAQVTVFTPAPGGGVSNAQILTVDGTPPDTTITSQPADPTNQTNASFSFTATEAGSTFQCQIDGGGYATCTSPATYSSLASNQTHTFNVRAVDQAGNTDASPAAYSWMIDTTAPNAPSVSGTTPTNNTTPTWIWTPGGGGNGTYRYKLDNNDLTTGATTTTGTSYTPASVQTEGSHTLYVQERDAAGNWSTSGSFAITIDTTVPTVAISASSLSVANSSVPAVTYTLTYTGADTVMCAAGHVTLNRTGTANGTVAISGDGVTSRTVTISTITGYGTLGLTIAANTASDAAGNVAAGAGPSATFTVDNSSGDFDGDGDVTATDALKALRIAAGLDTPTGADSAHGDVAPLVSGSPQPNGKIDIGDVVVILRRAVRLVTW